MCGMTNNDKQYVPTCPEGVCNCVCDPAYIKIRNPKKYEEIWGDSSPEQAIEECMRWTGEESELE